MYSCLLSVPGWFEDGRLVVEMCVKSPDCVVTCVDIPVLVHTIPVRSQSLIKHAVLHLNVQEVPADPFILKFALARYLLEGQVFRALEATLDNFSNELIKSVKFFQTRYPSVVVGGILLSGFASVIPKFDEYIGSKAALKVAVTDPWQKVRVSGKDQQQLMPISAEFATVVGLAQRSNK